MKKKPLGCLTTAGLIAMLVAVLVVGGSYAMTQSKMFSPGDLSVQIDGDELGGVSSHSDLEEDCAACHAAPWSKTGMTDLCLDCHVEIEKEMADSSTMHGAIADTFEDSDCRDCHTEHKGENGQITDYLGSDFPHELVGFALDAHSNLESTEIVCQDCHTVSFMTLEPNVCQECHEEIDSIYMAEHTALFGTACLECHDGLETYGSAFDHDDYFMLLGMHKTADCGACHEDAQNLVMLQDTAQECVDCHLREDAHDGSLGVQCESCHTPEGWLPAEFDHEVTGFSLVGGHANVDCASCHTDQTFQDAAPECASCHLEDDAHDGLFGEVCESCHVVTSWEVTNFDHSIPQAGDCQSCHSDDAPSNHYPGQCSACHITASWLPANFDHTVAGATDCLNCHTGDAPADHYGGQCSACHNTNGWLPASFNHAVAGATDCQSCHSGDRPSNHFSGQCSQCHSTNAWKPANFNHTFPMNHGGANEECTLCHTNSNFNNYTCYGCHEHSQANIQNEHEGISNLNNCVRCHANGQENDGDDGEDEEDEKDEDQEDQEDEEDEEDEDDD